jgi:hypothetical protein
MKETLTLCEPRGTLREKKPYAFDETPMDNVLMNIVAPIRISPDKESVT